MTDDLMRPSPLAASLPPWGQDGFEVLSRAECLRLLAQVDLGRVAVSVNALPSILPVHFALVGDEVVFPAVPGGQLDLAVRDAVVALEADHLDPEAGWSVVVTGKATEVSDPDRLRALCDSPALAGAPGEHWCLFRIPVEVVSGRRISRWPMLVGSPTLPAPSPPAPASESAAGSDLLPLEAFRFERLPVDECLRLLATEEVGRLVVVLAGRPHVFPVNYAMDSDAVVFRTAGGTKLEAVSRSLVAFEVDRLAPSSASGWSVVVEGVAQEVTSVDSSFLRDRLAALPLQPWAPGDRLHFVRIVPFSITGARLRPAASAPDGG
jgi:nitroimidazol reductase NimA-like FMN-containing flavoprotein (pyridoxamine 5'-phosphate oxidase superfamily)